MPRRHLIVPDTQIRKGVPVEHIEWAAAAAVHYRPDVIVVLGDWWDMTSLSSYEPAGSKPMEGMSYETDVESGNRAFERFAAPIKAEIRRTRRGWNPQCHFLFGNHEQRIERALARDTRLAGAYALHHLDTQGFARHAFLEVVWIDGIAYSHYFCQRNTGKAIGGTIENRLNRIGDSFVQGHEQGLLYSPKPYPTGRIRHGLVAGSFYLHDERYRGPQGNNDWRGIVVLNEVEAGDYDVMPLSMSYLRRKFG